MGCLHTDALCCSGSWKVDKTNEQAADDEGLGFKTERGDRAAVMNRDRIS